MRKLLILLCVLSPVTAQAGTLFSHARAMARNGRIWHDRARGRSSEVVAKTTPGIGQRFRARRMWDASPPHAAILKQRGWLRVRCIRGYCVGRK